MTKLKYIVPILIMALAVPISGYGFFDVGAYGGYSFQGNWKKPEITSSEFGMLAHASFTLATVVTLGLGAYYQRNYNEVTVEYSGGETKNHFTKDSVGLDGFVQLKIPKVGIQPYGRVSTSVWDQANGLRFKGYKSVTVSEVFKTYSFGGGIGIPLIQVPVVEKLQIYIEYLYTISKLTGVEMKTHTAHAGVRLFI